jgi:transposase-like protein
MGDLIANELIVPFVSSSSLSAGIMSHCVWLCFRFSLRFHNIEEMVAKRGIAVREALNK